MPEYRKQWKVQGSAKDPYTVSVTVDGVWSCSCIGWTRHIPRKDCKHIEGKKAEEGGQPKPARRTVKRGETWEDDLRERQAAAESAQTVQAALKAGANPEQATDAARAKREEVQAKKDARMKGIRFGFQLAEEPKLDELVIDRPMASEIKFDGHLALLIDGKIINRSGRDITKRFPEIEKIDGPAVLLGELIIPDEKGLGDFSGGIQTRNTDDEMKIRALSQQRPAMFVAFDILEVAGEDVTRLSARQRRILLEGVYEGFDKIVGTAPRRHQLIKQELVNSKADVLRLLERERARGGEGLMLKDLNAPYVAKRGRAWLKVKTWSEATFTIESYQHTGIGDGFTVTIKNKGREQTVVVNDHKMREAIKRGAKRLEVKYLSVGNDGALRFPSARRLTSNP